MLLLRLIFVLFLFVACSVKGISPEQKKQKTKILSTLLVNLDSNINKTEAYDLAKSSIEYSQKLAQQYEAISSPWIQNSLVNIGLKNRGLCYEWAEDLLYFLASRGYRTLEFHAVGANIGYLNEHNALAVSAKGEGIEESILLDAWRNSGDLYFKKLYEDKKYDWVERKGLYKSRK